MPPKRQPSKKGGKSKSPKGGKKKDKKGKKAKPKKIPKKWINVRYESEAVYFKPREELEAIAIALRNQIQEERGERIRFQMERDMLAELNSLYVLRLRELRTKREWNQSMVNRMNQDVADQEVIKAQEGKHFRYESQLMLSSGQMRDELRRKRLRENLSDFWKFCCLEMAELSTKIKEYPPVIKEIIEEKKAILDADTAYIDEIEESRIRFAEMLEKASEDMKKELEIMSYFEVSSETQRYNDVLTKFSNDFEWIFLTAKNYYLDQVHNMLTLIMKMMDEWDKIEGDSKRIEDETRRYGIMCEVYDRKLNSLRTAWRSASCRHAALERLRTGLDNTYRKVRESEEKVKNVMDRYRILTHEVTMLEDERSRLKKAAKKCQCPLPKQMCTPNLS